MYEWYGERYWGAAHGLAGIMNVLLECQLASDEREDVKGTLRYMIQNRHPSGNYPVSEEDKKRDVLVHWCHGAPGVALTLARAAEVMDLKPKFFELLNAFSIFVVFSQNSSRKFSHTSRIQKHEPMHMYSTTV